MDSLALSVSKSITDFLEQNERRFISQNSQQEHHNQLLIELQTKFEKLENRCEQLEKENTSLKDELQSLKQRGESSSNDIITIKSNLDRVEEQTKKYADWLKIMVELTQQVHNLKQMRDETKEKIDDLSMNQTRLDKKIERQQRDINSAMATARAASASASVAAAASPSPIPNAPHYNVINRTPVRPKATASFFNGNIGNHSSIHRFKPQTSTNTHHHYNHYPNEDYSSLADPYDEVSELSENAEQLIQGVQALNDLQRSFEKGSICSD